MDNNQHPNQAFLEQAIELENEGQTDDAIVLYHKIIELSPNWSTPFYNLGLIHKYRGEWQQSFYYNQKATESDASNEAAWWNLGIAATALKDWKTARKAWNFFDLKLEVTNDELNMNLGNTPVRLNPYHNAEVVWAERIDPARSIIKSVPLPESNHRHNDLLLNDGAPVGYRISDGIEYPVFNELQLISQSDFKTYSIVVETDNQDLIDKLAEFCDKAVIGFEDWTTVRLLCKQCSEGTPHEQHDHENKPSAGKVRKIGFAAINHGYIEKTLKEWRKLSLINHSDVILELE